MVMEAIQSARPEDTAIPSLSSGYKQTDAGVIPDDWLVTTLGKIVDFLDGQRKPVKAADRRRMRGNIPYYGASGVIDRVNDYIFDEDLILLGEDGENILSRELPLAFQISGKAWVNNHAHVLRPHKGINHKFLCEYLESIDYDIYNSGTAQPKLNKKTCFGIPVALPANPDEQDAIAEVLNDADLNIKWLRRLIEKKRLIKQGAMQELLTGRRRLPGFSEEWATTVIGDVLEIRHGKSQKEVLNSAGPYPVLATSGEIGRASRFLHDKPSVLIGRKGTIDRPQYMDVPFWTVDTLFYSDVNENLACAKYLYYSFLLIDWRRYNEASGVPSLNANTIGSIELHVPPKDEQIAIEKVLTEIEEDVCALEKRLEKARQIKQGMMQELLSGRVRLV